jgi:hypothetical protein
MPEEFAMKRILGIVLGAAMCASAFAGDANADFAKFAKEMAPRAKRAFEAKNVKFFESTAAPDFVDKMMGQPMTRKQSMAEMKRMFDESKSIKADLKVLSTKASGNTGVAMTFGHMTIITKPTKQDPKSHKLVMDMWLKETWVRSGKTWKMKMIETAKPMKMMMDGKPMDPSQMGGGG